MNGGEVNHPAVTRRTGSYTANLLGNIRSHLAGLQGYDVMALELIQNADDACAEEVVFDITDEGLVVRNSGVFTYCGDLDTSPCSLAASLGYDCDYHRIVDVGSGGKLLQSENIGRFGIGFLSTYQVCDHPEIRSAGIRLTLVPESGEWIVDEPFDEPGGTTLSLPWARDPASATRLALRISHVGPSHIDRILDDITRVLRHSLLFLRHVRKAEVRRDGALLLGCELDRAGGSHLRVSFHPSGEVERWQILRADAADSTGSLYAAHPQLAPLGRSTEVAIGLRVEPALLSEGRLYAFLPTEQPTGLPLHINADFFPESDRKQVIFGGHQHEQAWNEMLVEAAAEEIARDPEGLLEMLGPTQLWEFLGRAYELEAKKSGLPECYRCIWDRIKATAPLTRIVPAQDGSVRRPEEVYLPPNALTVDQAEVLLEVGGRIAAEDLRPFRNAMNQLGAHFLTLERFVDLLETAMPEGGGVPVDDDRVVGFFRPLWRTVEELIPAPERSGPGTKAAVERLKRLPLMVTEHRLPVAIDESYAVPGGLDHGSIAASLPGLAVVSRRFDGYPSLRRLVRALDLDAVAAYIGSRLDSASPEEIVGSDPTALRAFYRLLVDLDDRGTSVVTVYEVLRALPIWPSSRGLIPATHVFLPGDFNDPIGRSDLLDTAVLSARARGFLTGKLGVRTQTIKAYVQTVLPEYFGDAGPADPAKYGRLMTELGDHLSVANDETTRRLLGSLRLVPTRDGGWARPGDSYRRSEDLVRVLGEAKQLWLDESRIPDVPSVHILLDLAGIRRTVAARHLVERIVGIADGFAPRDDARAASGEAFYALCDIHQARKEDAAFKEAIAELRGADCLPADGDSDAWYPPGSLYAPFRADAFRSQAHILAFRSTARLNRELLEDVGVTINPSTRLVLDHLKHCMEHGVAPHRTTYQVLNERAQVSDPLVSELQRTPCIYVNDGFVRTNQVYWVAQQLGRYAFTVPESIKSFTPLFRAIGVKDAPECSDYVDMLLDLVGEHYEGSLAVTGTERTVYNTCLAAIAAAREREECGDEDLRRLAEGPTILNLAGMATLPDEILLHDSEWYAGFFRGDLDQALCRLPAEHWALAEALGVRRLSESARVSLDYVGPPEREEMELAETLAERTDIFVRLLHDQPAPVREGVRIALTEIEAVSGDDLRTEASVDLGGDTTFASPSAAHAFYDSGNGRLTVRRPVDRRSWPHILNAVFHQLMPGATGGEISKLTLGVRPLMEMGVGEAHRELTDAGVPDLDSGPESAEPADLASQELGELGAEEDAAGGAETDGAAELDSSCEPSDDVRHVVVRDGDHQNGVRNTEEEHADARGGRDAGAKETGDAQDMPDADIGDRGDAQGDVLAGARGTDATPPRKKARPRHKKQWDRRLLSYVRRKTAESPEDDGNTSGDPLEHNLAVEAVARAAVCSYEEERGRLPEQMVQTHPGYDIVSHDPVAGEDRLIEVKGVAGEWNRTGVGLSGLQFSNAQNYGDQYWLYVVEFVEDAEHMRIHPIQSPAMRVTAFMFDGNWREAAANERADPTMRFVPGVRVHHESMGTGEIRDVVVRGISKSLTIWFDRTQQVVPNVALNLAVIRVLEEEDGDDGT